MTNLPWYITPVLPAKADLVVITRVQCDRLLRGEVLDLPVSFAPRTPELEADESIVQLVVYAAVVDPEGRLLWYRRGADGDARLAGKWSCGFGGHVEYRDVADSNLELRRIARAATRRELREELSIDIKMVQPEFLGYIRDEGDPVGRVHLGIALRVELPEALIASMKTTPEMTSLSPGTVPDGEVEGWSCRLSEMSAMHVHQEGVAT